MLVFSAFLFYIICYINYYIREKNLHRYDMFDNPITTLERDAPLEELLIPLYALYIVID